MEFESLITSATEDQAFAMRIQHDRCENWINGLPRAAITNAVTGALTFLLLRTRPGDPKAYGWLFAVLGLNIVRLAMTPVMQKWLQRGESDKTRKYLIVSLVFLGVLWAIPGVAFFPSSDMERQAILAVALLSVSAGAVMSYIVTPNMALVVPALVILPYALRIGAELGMLPVILALLCVLFLVIVFFMERDWGQYVEQNLHLSIHNEHLSQKWKRAHQEAVDAIRAKEIFLRKMSHEIRTPLNGIQGMTKLLLTQNAQGVNRQSLKVIEESSDRLLLLIKELFGEFGEKPEITEEAVNSLFLVDPDTSEGEPRGTLLIVEDNPVNQMVLAMHLEKRGYRIETASSGDEALRMQKLLEFEGVLMDCQMPGMDGFETTRAWRKAESKWRRTPIIAVTANAVSGDRNRCLEAGMDDYIPKPIDPKLLFQKLDIYLAKNTGGKMAKNGNPMSQLKKTELNLNALEALRDFDDGKGEVLNEVVKKFMETTAELLAPFRGHCENHKWDEVRHIAHTVKSSAATVGAMALSEIAKRMEHNMREKNYVTVMPDCNELFEAYVAAQKALKDYVAGKKAA